MSTIAERFAEFHEANPHVYYDLRRLAFQGVNAGRTRLGISQLFEVLRWEWHTRTTETAPNLNNDYRALYARKLMDENPRLAGVFETRKARASVGIADGLAVTLRDDLRRAA